MRTIALVLFLQSMACNPATETPPSVVARVHEARCGTCHARVEPGQRGRDELDTALLRHRRRVRLDEAEWREMVDYLAAPLPRTKS
jgi:hypothetical protein